MYPKISIITPSYNQGKYIEETILSILNQGYPNLEYIIIDGGSDDNTVEIIRKYEKHLAYWVSETDRGQAHAINKGLEKATGDIFAYLNSDDYYLPNAFLEVSQAFLENPETDLLHGRCRYVNEFGEKIGEQFGNIQTFDEIIDLWDVWWKKRQLVQPEVFWSKRIKDRIGTFREDLCYVMDFEYWCRILYAGGTVASIDKELACFRFTSSQKSNQNKAVADELLKVVYPWLWGSKPTLSAKKRYILQGKWLYQTVLLQQIDQSIKFGDRKGIRLLKSILNIVKHPKILLAPEFFRRLKAFSEHLLPYLRS
jgi:glycosyltransferase involved in cell wall biosynthesis